MTHGVLYWQSEQSLVEGSGEEGIQQVLVDQSQAENTATETEPEPDTHALDEIKTFLYPDNHNLVI